MERDTVVEIAVSGATVLLFVAAVLAVGLTFDGHTLARQGALALIAVIFGFVIVMSGVGYFLSGR